MSIFLALRVPNSSTRVQFSSSTKLTSGYIDLSGGCFNLSSGYLFYPASVLT